VAESWPLERAPADKGLIETMVEAGTPPQNVTRESPRALPWGLKSDRLSVMGPLLQSALDVPSVVRRLDETV
jgi:hypothetical protein